MDSEGLLFMEQFKAIIRWVAICFMTLIGGCTYWEVEKLHVPKEAKATNDTVERLQAVITSIELDNKAKLAAVKAVLEVQESEEKK
jgi:hypothetical protein